MAPDPDLDQLRGGDETAFHELVQEHQAGLHAHCYRMLGSVHDADDVLQEVLIRAWRGLTRIDGSSPRTWLYRIATNACLTALAGRERRSLPVDHGPASPVGGAPAEPINDPVWLHPYPDPRWEPSAIAAGPEARYDQREAVELAFVAALQFLPPKERAVLILRDVLGFSAAEAAESLATTTVAVDNALEQARVTVAARVPEPSQQVTLRQLGDERLASLVTVYARAMEQADADAVARLLTDDATWTMPPIPTWFRGTQAITAFLRADAPRRGWRHVVTSANGQPAVGSYCWDHEEDAYTLWAIDVLTVRGSKITGVTAFLDRSAFHGFDLPGALPDE